MNWQVGGTCYGSDAAAYAAIASAEVGKVLPAGSEVYVLDAVPGASGIAYSLQSLTGGAGHTFAATPTLVPCGLLDWSDALAVGWPVAAVWICIAGVLFLRRAADA